MRRGKALHSSSRYPEKLTRIFYVEDEPFLAKIVKETLESKNYEVTLVSDGAMAMSTFENNSFDACILDIMLPNKNGYDIAKEIRTIDSQIPILFLTAKDQTADLIKGFDVGGNDYIRKPFSMVELFARIDNLIKLVKLKYQSSEEEIKVGHIYSFLPSRLTLSCRDKTKNLSHRESQIIQLLCSNINDITNRKEILLKVWGDDSFYNSRNLDVYISKIRGYFKEDPTITIKTLKGVGYRFVVD